jgi:hypothetical protein
MIVINKKNQIRFFLCYPFPGIFKSSEYWTVVIIVGDALIGGDTQRGYV